MNSSFTPDYQRIAAAAQNRETSPFPLYEHSINRKIISELTGKDLDSLYDSRDRQSLRDLFSIIADFHIAYGYDAYSFEGCFTELIQGGEGLLGRAPSIITDQRSFETYPWDTLEDRYFDRFAIYFEAIKETLPQGMKIIGGVGNGVFETIQDFVPFTELAYLQVDHLELFNALWVKLGDTLLNIWKRFLSEYGDILAVGRFGDDLGFKSAPLLNPTVISEHIIPQYKKIIDTIHRSRKPFLLHSCGCIFPVMEEIIEIAGIDAKHSNEDVIAPFSTWVEEYGDRIGNFGGFDMDVVCRSSVSEIRDYIIQTLEPLQGKRGIAVGTGNQVSDYVPAENFEAMISTVREIRGY